MEDLYPEKKNKNADYVSHSRRKVTTHKCHLTINKHYYIKPTVASVTKGLSVTGVG